MDSVRCKDPLWLKLISRSSLHTGAAPRSREIGNGCSTRCHAAAVQATLDQTVSQRTCGQPQTLHGVHASLRVVLTTQLRGGPSVFSRAMTD